MNNKSKSNQTALVYEINGKTFVVEPYYKDNSDSANETVDAILLRLMKEDECA